MKHMASGRLAFIGVLALAGCYSYTGEAINNSNFNKIQATPSYIVVKAGDSTQVIARLVNDANTGTLTNYQLSAIGSGITVHQNLNYRPIFDSKTDTLIPTGDKTAQQFYVVGVTPGQYSFTMTPTSVNTGVSLTITVVVTPATLQAGLSKTTAVAGDTVTITAPAGTVFSQTSALSFAAGGADTVIARSADSTMITFITNGGHAGPATITKVGLIANPAVQTSTIATTNSLTTPAINAGTTSKTTAIAGDIITITAPANQYFSDTNHISFAKGPAPLIISRAADSSSITFKIGPDSGQAIVTGVGIRNAKGLIKLQNASSSTTVAAPVVAVASETLNGLPITTGLVTPNIGVPVTVQLQGNLRAIASTRVFIGGAGGTEAGIVSVSADSTTIVIMPMTRSFGLLNFQNVVVATANDVPFTVIGDHSVNVTNTYSGPVDAVNALSPATAPTLTLPPPLRAQVLTDAGGWAAGIAGCQSAGGSTGLCRMYKVTLATARTVDVELRWDAATVSDMGVYRLTTAGALASSTAVVDALGAQAGGPEVTGTNGVSLPAGTYLLGIMAEANATPTPQPQYFQLRIFARN